MWWVFHLENLMTGCHKRSASQWTRFGTRDTDRTLGSNHLSSPLLHISDQQPRQLTVVESPRLPGLGNYGVPQNGHIAASRRWWSLIFIQKHYKPQRVTWPFLSLMLNFDLLRWASTVDGLRLSHELCSCVRTSSYLSTVAPRSCTQCLCIEYAGW